MTTIVGVYRDALVLRHASALLSADRTEPLEGDVAIPRAKIALAETGR